MPMRMITMDWMENGRPARSAGCRQDVHAEAEIRHTLVPGGRYLVSPIQWNKCPRLRGRTCVFLKARRFRGDVAKAKVQFEDDGSIGHVEPVDLLPVQEG